MSLDPNLRFLCKDDLSPVVSANQTPTRRGKGLNDDDGGGGGGDGDGIGNLPKLTGWWKSLVSEGARETMPVESMKTIVGRICGLMSVVSVWTLSKPRMEVRTLSQAVGESGRRLADIVLLPRQAELLARPSLHRLWLTGPMGSGKTLMLQLKGRQWFQEGRRVIVVNMRTTSKGRPQGHVLEESIRRGDAENHHGMGSVVRYDIALDEFQFEGFQKDLESKGTTENACFVLDEVLSEMSSVAREISQHYPHNPIWCVANYVAPVPITFHRERLDTVLRSPPSVQLMLKELDLNPRHQSVYATRSAARGFPCDGPPIIFIEHSKHKTNARHLDCPHCAEELANILEHKLGITFQPPTTQKERSSRKPPQPRKTPDTIEAASLTFRDVIILAVIPTPMFVKAADYHWTVSFPRALEYLIYVGSSRFISGLRQRGVPLKIATDSTLKEIAFPTEDEVIVCENMGSHSLEKKVVVCLKGGPAFTHEEMIENVSRYPTIQKASSSEWVSLQEVLKPPLDSETVSKHLRLFASLINDIRDIIYPQPSSPLSSEEDAKSVFQYILGNSLVADTQNYTGHSDSGHNMRAAPSTETTEGDSVRPRRGMEYRCDVPMLQDPSYQVPKETESSLPAPEETGNGEKGCESSGCSFLVPDLQENLAQRRTEVQRIRQALQDLSEDDLDWEFFAASRCLSQYITIV